VIKLQNVSLKSASLGEALEEAASLAPRKIAIVEGDKKKSFKELDTMANALAASLQELGLRKGDRIAIYMKSSIEFVVSFYAIEKLGGIVAWVNPNYRKTEAEFILRNSEARGIVIFREWDGYDYLDAVLKMKENLPHLEFAVVVGEGEGENIWSFYDLLNKGYGRSFSAPAIESQNDLAMLIYTSGTTGRPKGAMITHFQAVNGALQYSLGVQATSEDIFIGILPMSHSYGCGSTLILPTLLRSTLVLMDKFDAEKTFQLIEKERITLQLASPAHYILELNHPKRSHYDLSSLRAGLIAGQIAPEGLITRVDKEMGIYLTSFWGASEVGPGLGIICPYPSSLEIREAYIGKPIEGTMVRVADPVTRKEVPEGQMGELTLKGWPVLKGYWNNPEETRKQVIDGWLHMGDLVSREKEGYLKIYGRTKDLINRGGYKVYPYELESLLIDHPKVQEVCIVATPNPILGESICACVIPRPGQSLSLKDLRDFLQGKIAPHKLPDELCTMEEFPRLSGGVKLNKFGRGGLAELAQKDVNLEKYRR
jgi:acyl-CoA synthetase (AMP-forming)/AMP-acid ligase II